MNKELEEKILLDFRWEMLKRKNNVNEDIIKALSQIKTVAKREAKGKKIKGRIHGGFKGECSNRNPWYIISESGEDGIFICDILKKYAGKRVRITIEKID